MRATVSSLCVVVGFVLGAFVGPSDLSSAGPSIARADAVSPCPPGFSPSHAGCRFDPAPADLGVCGACACVLVVLGLAGAAFAHRAGRARGPREG